METTYKAEQTAPPSAIDDYRIMPAWCGFVLGGVATFLLVYLGIARPTAHELDVMRHQMAALEQSIWKIAGTRDGVGDANSLLAELTQQSAEVGKARRALKDVQALRRQLQHEAGNLQQALGTVAELGAIKESLLSYAGQAREAADVICASEQLCCRLAESAGATYEALQASDDLLAIRDDLLQAPQATAEASDSLTELLDLREQLNDHADELATAENALQDLLTLKSMVLAHRPELVTTLETLEIIQDLSREFDQATVSFQRIRHWMVEVVASESVLERARQSLAPLTEMASIRHLDPSTLRQMARKLSAANTPQIASKPESSRSALSTATSIQEEDLVVE